MRVLLVCAALLSALLAHGAPPVQAAGVFAGRSLPRVGALATPQEALLATSSAPVAQLPQGPGSRVGVPAAHAGHTTVLQIVLLALLVPACWQARRTVKPGFQTKPRLTLRKELIVTCLLLLLATPVAGGRRSRAQRRTAALGSSGGTSSVLGSQPARGPPAASPARDCPQNPPCIRRSMPSRAELSSETPRPGLHAESAEARTGGAAGAGPSWSCPCGHVEVIACYGTIAVLSKEYYRHLQPENDSNMPNAARPLLPPIKVVQMHSELLSLSLEADPSVFSYRAKSPRYTTEARAVHSTWEHGECVSPARNGGG